MACAARARLTHATLAKRRGVIPVHPKSPTPWLHHHRSLYDLRAASATTRTSSHVPLVQSPGTRTPPYRTSKSAQRGLNRWHPVTKHTHSIIGHTQTKVSAQAHKAYSRLTCASLARPSHTNRRARSGELPAPNRTRATRTCAAERNGRAVHRRRRPTTRQCELGGASIT